MLPFAVSLQGGHQTFTVSKVAGCSSLLNFTDPAVRANWAPFCKDTLEKRTVDTITPAQLGALLPPDLPSTPCSRGSNKGLATCSARVMGRAGCSCTHPCCEWPIALISSVLELSRAQIVRAIKLDAQGLDLKLLKAMPEEVWSRTLAVQLEVRLRHCAPLYVEQETCEDNEKYMISRGFAPQVACRPGCPWCRPPSCEQNILYIRKEAKGGGQHKFNHLKKHDFPAWVKNGDIG